MPFTFAIYILCLFCVSVCRVVAYCFVVCCFVLCIADVWQQHSLRKVVIEEKEPQPGARTQSLCSNTEIQPCEPPI